MKIVFMGTPDFAVGALEALIRAGHEITAVVTQPDKAKGRSGKLQFSPVKECALKHDIPVFQPKRIKTPEAVMELRTFPAEVFVVAAFGQILSQEILDMPRFGCLNIHASLLPGYRGASPIQHVILDGEEKTGVTIQQMNAGIDTGDILYQTELNIDRKDTFETLHDKLMNLGGPAIVETLSLLEKGELKPRPQKEELASYAPLITKEMGRIDFTRSAMEIEQQIRGLNPWPGSFSTWQGKQLKIWEAEAQENPEEQMTGTEASGGQILKVCRDCVVIAAGKGILKIYSLQLEGKKRMSAHDFLLGVRMKEGDRLGS